ncbi:MAG: glycosyltransferase family 4 protein [Puniceicoccales bacterium]
MARIRRVNETPTVLHFVGAGLDVGGVLSYVRSLAQFNSARNILLVSDGFVQKRRPFLKLFPIAKGDYQTLFSPVAVWQSLRHIFWLRRKLARRPHMIFHGHSRGGVLIGVVLVLLGYRNVVVTIHHNGSQRWFYRLAHKLLKGRMIFICPAMKRYYKLPVNNWRDCIPGSVSPTLKRNRPQTAGPFGPRSDKPLILGGCGLIVEWKRWEIVLEALGLLAPELRERVRFIHVGDPLDEAISIQYGKRLKSLVKRHGLEKTVEWRGHQNDLNIFFDEINLLVHPAQNEPFGLSVVESLFSGTPVIAADTVGAADLFTADSNGLTFPENDARALASLFDQILRGELPMPRVDRQSLRPLHPDYLGARWAEVYARLSEEPTA